MSMKLSYRDKVILVVVLVLVILGIGIFCFIKPQYESLQVSKERLAAKEDEKSQVDAKIGTLEQLQKKLEDDIKAVEEDQKQFLSEKEYGETFQISQYLMEMLSQDNFKITGIAMDRLETTELNSYTYDKYAVGYPLKINGDINGELPPEVQYAYDNSYPEPPEPVEVAGNVVTVTYECDDAAEIFNAVQKIADNDKNLYVQTFSGEYKTAAENKAEADPEKALFGGDIVIEVYEILPLDPEAVKNAG